MTVYTIIFQPQGKYIYQEAQRCWEEDTQGYLALPIEIYTVNDLTAALTRHAECLYRDEDVTDLILLQDGAFFSDAQKPLYGEIDGVKGIYEAAKAAKEERARLRHEVDANAALEKARQLQIEEKKTALKEIECLRERYNL